VRLPPDARRLAATVFQNLRPRELLRLIEVGETLDHEPGAHVIRQGDALAHLAIVIDGTARVELADRRIVELSHGAFIGELSYLTGKPPAADVIAATALRVVRWPADALRAFLAANPDTRTAVQLVLGADLAAKLRGTVSSNAT
jgi:CRP-like cAMP-binding protein